MCNGTLCQTDGLGKAVAAYGMLLDFSHLPDVASVVAGDMQRQISWAESWKWMGMYEYATPLPVGRLIHSHLLAFLRQKSHWVGSGCTAMREKSSHSQCHGRGIDSYFTAEIERLRWDFVAPVTCAAWRQCVRCSGFHQIRTAFGDARKLEMWARTEHNCPRDQIVRERVLLS